MRIIEVLEGDKGYDINFTLKDADAVAIDITSATLLLKTQRQGETALKFSGSMAIVSGTAGTCKYTVAATDFDEPGDYYGEIEVTFSGGNKILTFSDIVFRVKRQLPRSI